MGEGGGKSYECIVLEVSKEYLEETFGLPMEEISIDSKFEFEKAKGTFERLNTTWKGCGDIS